MADFSRARSTPRTATLLTVAGGALLVGAAAVGVGALAAAVVVLQFAAAASWHDLLRAPGARAGSLIGLGAGVAATVTLAVGTSQGPSGALSVVAVVGLFLAFAQQLLTADSGRPRLTALTATVALVIVEVLAASWLSAAAVPSGPWVVAIGAMGAVLAVLAVAGGGTSSWVVVVAVAACAALGAVLGIAGPSEIGPGAGAGIGAAAGLAAVCGVQVRRLAGRSARTAPATVAALPLVVAGPAAFIVARIMLG